MKYISKKKKKRVWDNLKNLCKYLLEHRQEYFLWRIKLLLFEETQEGVKIISQFRSAWEKQIKTPPQMPFSLHIKAS